MADTGGFVHIDDLLPKNEAYEEDGINLSNKTFQLCANIYLS